MLVLPNTPCMPKPLNFGLGTSKDALSAESLSYRASISSSVPENHAELTQYMLRLEQYLESVFEDLKKQCGSNELEKLAAIAVEKRVSIQPAWTNVIDDKPPPLIRIKRLTINWSIATEVVATVIAKAETYMKLGADLISDLMEQTPPESGPDLSKETDQKWRSVAEHYKSAISLISFGRRFQTISCSLNEHTLAFNPSIFALFDRICDIGIQMSILCKSSWMNRATFATDESFTSSNNGILCRVAIWVFNEVVACQNLVRGLQKSMDESSFLNLNYDKWSDYLNIFFRYVTAYSGLFLSIENYQKSNMGQAIGLINFSLLTLQSKNLGEDRKGFSKLTKRITGRKNESFIANLQSVTSLNIDKSIFSGSSGAMLSDLATLFDQLVILHLKFSKENDNLQFETVADWKDSRSDSKWPLGAKIPVSPAKEYLPRPILADRASDLPPKERPNYY